MLFCKLIYKQICSANQSGLVRGLETLWTSLWSTTIPKSRDLHLQCHHFSDFSLPPNLFLMDFHGQALNAHRPRPLDLPRGTKVRGLANPFSLWRCNPQTVSSVLAVLELDSSNASLRILCSVFPCDNLLGYGLQVRFGKYWCGNGC